MTVAAPVVGRYILAVLTGTLLGSAAFATVAAAEEWISGQNRYFTVAQMFEAVFVYSAILSLPVVAVALPVFGAAANRFAAIGGRRRLVVIGMGAAGGLAIGALVIPPLAEDAPLWVPPLIGLNWGLSSAVAGLILLPGRSSGEQGG